MNQDRQSNRMVLSFDESETDGFHKTRLSIGR